MLNLTLWRNIAVLTIISLLVTAGVRAQDAPLPSDAVDTPTEAPIGFGSPVFDTISEDAFFDWWLLTVREGDEFVIEMFASDGLEPLMGLLAPNMDLVARSDGERIEPANGIAVIQHIAEEDGVYRIIATRNGNQDGTSTGNYRLLATLVDERPDLLATMPAEFRCGEQLAYTALSIQFSQAPFEQVFTSDEQEVVYEFYRLTVYGLDGFEPFIRIDTAYADHPLDCSDDGQRIAGNRLILPDGTDITYTQDDEPSVAQLTLTNSGGEVSFGAVRFLVASKAGTSGRFVAVLEGLTLQERRDATFIQVRKGALAREEPLTVYMVADHNSRLNPFIVLDTADGDSFVCDDAGRGACDNVPSWVGYGTELAVTNMTLDYFGRRFDAGVIIDSNSLDTHTLRMGSNNGDTHGRYTVYFLGEIASLSRR